MIGGRDCYSQNWKDSTIKKKETESTLIPAGYDSVPVRRNGNEQDGSDRTRLGRGEHL